MGILALVLAAALAAQESLGLDAEARPQDPSVVLPPPVGSADPAPRPAPEIAPEPRKAVAPIAVPVEAPARVPKPLEDRIEAGPTLGGFVLGSIVVVGLLGGAYLLLRRFARGSKLLGAAHAIRLLARRPIGQKQEILLVEVGSRVFMIGSTRDHLSALGEFSGDEKAALRASLPGQKEGSAHAEFSESLREGLRQEEAASSEASAPREQRVFASIADELAEIRRTVRAWRA